MPTFSWKSRKWRRPEKRAKNSLQLRGRKRKRRRWRKKQQFPSNDDNDDDRDDDDDDNDDDTGMVDMLDSDIDVHIQDTNSFVIGKNKKSKGNKGNKEKRSCHSCNQQIL
jgi:hypothetical protein